MYRLLIVINKFSTVMTSPGPAFQECTESCHENVPAPKAVSSDLWSTDGLTILAQIEIVGILVHYQLPYNTSHTMKPSDPLLLVDVALRCGMYPQRAAVGNWVSLCVKCCRMVDSVPRWWLSLSWPIKSDHLSVADWMIPPSGREHSHAKTHGNSWKAGPCEVVTVEKQLSLLHFVSL